ncbi:MAG: hypothetical protein LC127_07550 [Chitinophagales bacterium]|nr:hypothetical protein [Chitinophagales bacterium]
MNKQQFNEQVEILARSQGERLLEVLDEVKNQIADARNGDYSVESRKCAIALIDEKLYNIVRQLLNKKDSKEEKYFSDMI